VSLINRLYHINRGKIKIDGIEIEKIELETLRKQIAVVLQDVFLFSSSILDNITLMNPDITISEVEHAAKMIDLHDFITQLPGGYSFNIMERGATLSVGQRQLLSFVRAILYNPSILILDEATASVDTETEQLIQHAIEKIIAGRTSIIIAHRLSTIRKADYIMVLDKGEIKEMGSHQELLDKRGAYFELIEKVAPHPLSIFLQVSLDGAHHRGGAKSEDLYELARAIENSSKHRLSGIMSVPPLSMDPARAYEQLQEIHREFMRQFPGATGLSAGMSGDYEMAVSYGATHVRVGSSILGSRSPQR
jgi:ABC-type methionine transport system ATPase subunit